MKTALLLYWSRTGNTAKVASSVRAGLEAGGVSVTTKQVEDAGDLDFFDYDLVCIGFPSHNWRPPKPMEEYLRSRFARYQKKGRIVPGAPVLPGKHALIFCTYSGPHTGVREAIPAGKYAGQFLEHLGFTVLDEWYVLAEFQGDEELSTMGRMGNIKGLPTEEDLKRIEDQTRMLVASL